MSVVQLADARTHLGITTSTYDAELQSFIDRCEASLSRVVGPLAATAVTADVIGGGSALILPTTPVISLTSVTDVSGGTLTVSDLHATTDGVVTWTVVWGTFYTFWAPRYTVVYQAGRATCPEDLKFAVLELVRDKWRTQRGGKSRPGTAPTENVAPLDIDDLIDPHRQVPG